MNQWAKSLLSTRHFGIINIIYTVENEFEYLQLLVD